MGGRRLGELGVCVGSCGESGMLAHWRAGVEWTCCRSDEAATGNGTLSVVLSIMDMGGE